MQPLTTFEIIQLIVILFATPLGIVLWFMLRKLIADVDANEKASIKRDGEITKALTDGDTEIEKSLADYKLHVSENFTTKNDLAKTIDGFTRSVDAIFGKLDRIEDKIDHKADKVPA